jgi:hypothetical protein
MTARNLITVLAGALELAFAQVQPQVLGRAISDGRVTTIYLAPRFATC